MDYAIYRLEKGNKQVSALENYLDRVEGKEHFYKLADLNKKHLNKSFELNPLCKISLHDAIEQRLKEGYKRNKAIRKDAVKYTKHLMSASHEKMKQIECNPEILQKWIQKNYEFIANEFGKDNIVRFVLHRDEYTPHLHAVTVNLTQDGRLCAKEILGNPIKMRERQDRYAKEMEVFGLQRGKKYTGIKHEHAKEYYDRVNEALEYGDEQDTLIIQKKAFGVTLGVDTSKSLKNYQNALKSYKIALKAKELEIKRLKDLLTKRKS